MDPELLGNAKSLMEWAERLEGNAFKKLSYTKELREAAALVRMAARIIVYRGIKVMDEEEAKRVQRDALQA